MAMDGNYCHGSLPWIASLPAARDAELRAVETALARPARVAGLPKGRVHWEPGAFAPITGKALAEFDAAPVFPQADQA